MEGPTIATFDPPVNRLIAALPRYVQIAESLLEQIESGQLKPGDRLPAERALSEMLGVNRMTVRRALRVLESRGLVVRLQGDGTYVAEPKIERQAARLTSFTIGMQRRGLQPGARIVSLEQRPVEASVGTLLQLPISAPVYSLLRLRSINQEPVIATEFEAELLAIPSGSPLMLERRLSFDLEGRPVEHGTDLYRGDRFRFVTELAPLEM